ncbi:MAG: response regulator [Firmicutes bacterium]|nr:response regulator [Bacillota bacterium]
MPSLTGRIGGKILLAEDNDTIRKLLKRLLETDGYTVTAVDNGLDARKKLVDEKFDMVLSDILMPGIDGIELLKEVRNEFGDIPVILITGNQSLENAKEAIHWGAFDYITKPFTDIGDVLRAVSRAVTKSHLQKEKENLINELDRKNTHLKNVIRDLDRNNARLDLLVYDLEWIIRLSRLITSEIQVEDIIERMTEGIYEIFKVSAWGVLLYDERESFLKIYKASPLPESIHKNLLHMAIKDFYIHSKVKLNTEDIKAVIKEKQVSTEAVAITQNQYQSALLRTGDKVHGIIFVYADIKSEFTQSKNHTLSVIAGQLSIAIENAKLIEKLKHTNKELKELSDFKDEMVGIAAHDLRSPLSAMLLSAGLLKNFADKMNEEEKKEALDGIVVKAKHMMSLLEQILDISVIESGNLILKKKQTSIRGILEHHYNQVAPYARSKNIELECDLDGLEAEAEVDVDKMGEVIDNLLTNAVKYTPSGGKVRMEAKFDDSSVEVCVRDSGVGIKETEKAKLFKKFSRTSSKPTGGETSTGLGLAIAKKIVDLHEGRIWVESEYGKGSSFYFTIPLMKKSKEQMNAELNF